MMLVLGFSIGLLVGVPLGAFVLGPWINRNGGP